MFEGARAAPRPRDGYPAVAGYPPCSSLRTMCGVRSLWKNSAVLVLLVGLVAPGASHCSNVAGSGPDEGTGQPGCPASADGGVDVDAPPTEVDDGGESP